MTGAGTGWRRRQAILNYPEAFREPTAEGDHFSTFLGMEHYRRTAHTRFDLKYHFVWITQYRKKLLRADVAVRLRQLVRDIGSELEVEILKEALAKASSKKASLQLVSLPKDASR